MERKHFEAKIDLPFGIKKGTKISKIGTKFYYYPDNNILFPFDCEKETNFFNSIKIVETLYKKGDTVYNRELYKYSKNVNIKANTELLVEDIDTSRNVIKYILSSKCDRTIRLSLTEQQVYIPKIYYFLNSRGKVSYDMLGKSPSIDRFRKNSDNFFESKEIAQNKLAEIMTKPED